MAFDKVVDSGKLDEVLTDIADQIRLKTDSAAPIAIEDMPLAISMIEGGGGYSANDILTKGISGVLTIDGNPVFGNKTGVMPIYAFADQNITDIIALDWEGVYATTSGYTFANNTKLVNVVMPKLKFIPPSMFNGCTALQTIHLPSDKDHGASGGAAFSGCTSLRIARLGWFSISIDNLFQNCANLDTLILPYNGVVSINSPTYWAYALKGTKFATTGGTIYVPGNLVESYKAAANWSTMFNSGLLTIRPLAEAPAI